ncbi:unnamed protein product [Coffea canephora]|uniref:Endonuclease/exonuclease/phosphatase domain-containing protein n=1 Tax=Coffea canephora TaxID=49390 RepID=A0A068V589_COFCA|nr:unnamed protein product [Coffea canephora]
MWRATSFFFPRFSSPSFSSSTICLCKMSYKAGPVIPKFIPVETSEITSISKPDGMRFSLVSYNVLAQAYVKSALFPHSPSSCLKWKARSQATLTVLKNLGADFLCLQEVDEYDSFYMMNMENLGYSSIYVQRSGQKRDGCAIFYKRTSAELVLEQAIDYNDLISSIEDTAASSGDKDGVSIPSGNADNELKDDADLCKAPGDHGDLNDPRVRLKRDCVGVMAVFKLKVPSCDPIIIANTHLYWDPELADVKLAQAKYLLSCLAQFKQLVSSQLDCTPSIIVAGDFNSVPGDQVYQYLVSGSSLPEHLPESSDDQPLPLSSVYAYTREEPHFTNCTPGFTGTLDYILFSPTGDVKPVSFLELPESESPDVIGGLPNHYHPSDHLPIGAEFEVLQ